MALLSGFDGVACHRSFTDFPRTIEGGKALGEYDAVALSLSFEGDYPNALRLLDLGGVPLRSAARGDGDPLVIAGGMAPTLNPEPLAPFVDVFFLGEAEAGLSRLHAFLAENRARHRPDLLQDLAEAALPGVYVPSRYRVTEEEGRLVERSPMGAAPPRVERVWAPLVWDPARTHIWAPDGPFLGAYLVEVSRGCSHGCRFCAAGYAIRPVRYLPRDALDPWVRLGAREFGRVGLVGAAVSDHPAFEDLARAILEEGAALSVSSFRVENLTAERMELLARGGLQTLTVALEAGTERLRGLLGKGIRDDDFLAACRLAGEAGLRSLRIYAMVGLPTETDDDIRALAALVVQARRALGGEMVTVSATPFMPKPHTPHQWEVMAPEAVLRARIRLLERLCGRQTGVRAVAETPKWSRVQGLFSRGGRSVADMLEAAHRTGDWRGALRSPLAASILDRPRALDEQFPWDFVGGVPGRDHLGREVASADSGLPPLPCQPGTCRLCGVCASP